MKVLIYTHEFPPFAGGAGMYSADLASGLAMLGVEVHVAIPFSGNVEYEKFGIKSHLLHFHYIKKWKMKKPNAIYFFLTYLWYRYALDCIIVTERGAQRCLAEKEYSVFPYVAVIHGTEIIDYFINKKKIGTDSSKKMERFYYDACACITGSNATHSLVKKQLNDKSIKVKVIHYGINFDRLYIPSSQTISEMRKKFGEKSEIVLCVGRLGLDKGHDILLYAFKKVLEKRPFAKLLIVGIGPLKNDLLDLRNSLGLESVVHFLGKVPQNVLSSYYSICDVFALPSKSENRWEGLGLVYLEANFYERPVVGGNEGGVPEAILNEQTGLVVNSRDHIAVANAIIRLLSDPEFRIKLGKIGKKRVLHYFNSDRMARETISVLNCCKQRFSYKINLKNFFLFITRYIKTLVLRILTYFLGQK